MSSPRRGVGALRAYPRLLSRHPFGVESERYSPPREAYEEGWPRHQVNAAQHPLKPRTGWFPFARRGLPLAFDFCASARLISVHPSGWKSSKCPNSRINLNG